MYCGAKQAAPPARKPKSRGNGQGSVYKERKSGKWIATVTLYYYTDAEGKKHRRTAQQSFATKTEAVKAIAELHERRSRDREARCTLLSLYNVYTHTKAFNALGDSQQQKLGYAWDRLAPLQNADIRNLTIDDMQHCVDGAVDTYYPARDMKVLLSHLYDEAIKREIVQYKKSEYIELPDQPKAKKERFTNDEVKAFYAARGTDDYIDYSLMMIFCGLRPGELQTLEMENIHLAERYMVGGIKTEAGIDREIPIPEIVYPVVERLYAKAAGERLLMQTTAHKMQFYERYYAALEKIGVRKLPPKTCRHTFFSLLTAMGVQEGLITEIGGHADYNTTMKNYVSISIDEKRNAVAGMGDFLMNKTLK